MKHLFSLVFALICVSCYAQEPSYTPMRLNYQFRGVKVDSLFLVPSYTDTTQANGYSAKNIPGSLIRTGSDFWMRNGTATAWLQNVNTGAGSTFTLDLQEVTDNGDTTTNILTSYDGNGLGYEGSVRVGVTDNIGGNIGSIVGVYGDLIDANPHSIELYTLKSSNENIFSMKSGGYEFNISNSSSNQISSVGALTISASALNVVSTDDITLDADSSLYIFADQNITIDSAQNISIQADDDMTIDAGDTLQINATTLLKINPTQELQINITNGNNFRAGDFTNAEKNGYVVHNINKQNINTNTADYTAEITGVFVVTNAGANNFIFPSADDYPGGMVIIINKDGVDSVNLSPCCGNTIYDKGTGNNLSTIPTTEMGTFFSDGANWYGHTQ